MLETKKGIDVARARLSVYSRAVDDTQERNSLSNIKHKPKSEEMTPDPVYRVPIINNANAVNHLHFNRPVDHVSANEMNSHTFAKTLAESVNLNRLPVPEPNVFSGDSLQYIEWKTSFEILIERKGVPPEEKIFYLKKYTGGPARKALEGFFYSSSKSAFDNARKVLDERNGHPFVMQKAFRDKLDKWPKISSKDPMGLRDFADYLQGCRDAVPHVPSLSVLNDCTEIQKLLTKLPDWAAVPWNREVTWSLESTNHYPNFSQFVDFEVKEAKVVCNPVSSLFALQYVHVDQRKARDTKANGANSRSLATASSDHETTVTKLCEYCGKQGHWIFRCDGFLSLTIGKKREIVQNKNLCFGCLRKGHLNKDCKRKHTCVTCKGKHPSCLHEERPAAVSKQGHWIFRCDGFLSLTIGKKREIVRIKNLCFGCLRKGHLNKDCKRKHTCVTCKGKHPSCLHEERPAAVSSFKVNRNINHSTSMVVPVWVSSLENPAREILTYALLDTQSDTTFILNDTVKSLQVSSQPVKLKLSTMTSQNNSIDSSRVCGLNVRCFNSNDSVSINHAYTRDFIPVDRAHIPKRETMKGWPHLTSIENDIPPLQSCDVGLLTGYNCPQALAPRKMLIGRDEEPYVVQTLLGWSIVGYINPSVESASLTSVCRRTTVHVKESPVCSPRDVITVLERDFEQDGIKDKKVSQEDIRFLNLLDETICQRDDKHLEMPLPFRERPCMPNNKHLALLRLNHLKRKLLNVQSYYDHYKQFMNEIINREDAEAVEDKTNEENVWYIPHHGVYHSKKPDKLRVVFDCSARYGNTSLNQHLLTGPDLTNGLVGVLYRFRRHAVAVMCDIEKMFHQFMVQEADRDFLRFLWWENRPMEYRMKVHLIGAASSPGCANYGLKHLAKLQKTEFPNASLFVQNDFYVDDGLSSTETEEEAIQLVKDSQRLCANGGLHLHKFISNRKRVIDSILMSERASDVKNVDLALEKLPIERALGVRWCVENDVFRFEGTVKNHVATRRSMLSIVASIFDPLGFLAPFTLTGKKILQEVCQKGVNWDDALPSCVKPEWENWIQDVGNLKLVEIPRSLKPADLDKLSCIELHHFSDASSTGYGQCTYIRYISENAVHCSLIMAKARVAPHKVVSIPRLELTAAVLSAKISVFLKEELKLPIDKEYFWTDSTVVLGYIRNEARRFHVFVANRVQMIRDVSEPNQWFYVSTEDNPADHSSRGLTASGIADSTWLSGPSFLWQREIETKTIDTELQLGDPEIKTVRTLCTNSETIPDILERLSRFSSWKQLVSVVTRIKRLSNGVKGLHPPTVEERQLAERTVLRCVQKKEFSNSFNALRESDKLPKTDSLYPLDPVLCNGLLCVGGRLRKADLSAQSIHPVILPKNSYITKLILSHVHQEV